MSEETFRPRRPKNNEDPLAATQQVRAKAAEEEGIELSDNSNFQIQGNAPAEFLRAMQAQKNIKPKPQNEELKSTSSHFKEVLESLKPTINSFEEIELPSLGRFYDGTNGPTNGILSIRPMTGEEEQILATPRFVKKGQAINMIFRKCIKENYRPEDFLTIDRTYLLIYLRGISYSPNYEVEVKCQSCDKKFATTINLDALFKENCPDNYGPILNDVFPTSKLPFSYRLSTGDDEQAISEYREQRSRQYGDSAIDDTLIYRTASLLNEIDGISTKMEIQTLLKNLPINDVSYARNCINEPPFGVDTNVEISCPNCLEDFEVDLPMEANFFFPRRKKMKTQA